MTGFKHYLQHRRKCVTNSFLLVSHLWHVAQKHLEITFQHEFKRISHNQRNKHKLLLVYSERRRWFHKRTAALSELEKCHKRKKKSTAQSPPKNDGTKWFVEFFPELQWCEIQTQMLENSRFNDNTHDYAAVELSYRS